MKTSKLIVLIFFLFAGILQADSLRIAFGLDKKGVRSVRLSFFESNNSLEYSIAHMWNRDAKKNKRLFDFGITPVWTFGNDTRNFQIGFGPHFLSKRRLGFKNLSTNFQFGSFLRFSQSGKERFDYMFQHLSNAGIKEPNDGVNVHSLGYSWDLNQ